MPIHLLLVDPNSARRDAYHAVLHRDIVVQSLGDPALLTEVSVVDVAVIALRQTAGHGLDLGRALKAKHPNAVVVVYGKVEGQAATARLAERWGIDTHLSFIPEPRDVAALAETARLAEQRVMAAHAVKTWPPEPKQATPTWRELLTGPLTAATLRTIARKELFSA